MYLPFIAYNSSMIISITKIIYIYICIYTHIHIILDNTITDNIIDYILLQYHHNTVL